MRSAKQTEEKGKDNIILIKNYTEKESATEPATKKISYHFVFLIKSFNEMSINSARTAPEQLNSFQMPPFDFQMVRP